MHIIHESQQSLREISVTTDNIKNIMYMDQTRKFPVVLSHGNRYIMVLYETDGNIIIVKPMKARLSGNMCWTYNKLMMQLTDRGIKWQNTF